MEKIYTVEEMAEILNMNINSLRIKIRDGEFKGYIFKTGKRYMIKESDLNAWIEEQKKKVE